jgi:hypothetical protein
MLLQSAKMLSAGSKGWRLVGSRDVDADSLRDDRLSDTKPTNFMALRESGRAFFGKRGGRHSCERNGDA